MFNTVWTADISDHNEGKGDADVNGCSDVDVLPSNTASHLSQLLNLQRNAQVSHVAVLFSLFSVIFSEILILVSLIFNFCVDFAKYFVVFCVSVC